MGTSDLHNNKAIIIGAGIGGLCAGIALQNNGWKVVVLEKADGLHDGGAGIVLAANAIKALNKLGKPSAQDPMHNIESIADQVKKQGNPVGKAEIRTWNGAMITELPVDQQEQLYGTPSYLIHRTKLQSILFEQLMEGGASLYFRKKLVNWVSDEAKVTAMFEDGTTETGDVLIGADGLHSMIREKLHGKATLRYSGFTALRGIAEFSDERYSKEIGGGFEAWGTGKRFGFSHLGQGQVFWFAAMNGPQGTQAEQGQRKYTALQRFKGWYPPIEAVIEATEESAILAHDIFDCKPLSSWGRGRVTLLGDAAHPMLPNLGQGGAQAMEDALVLADCLQDTSTVSVAAALAAYEQRRIPRTSKIVRQSRAMARMVQLESAPAIMIRNWILRKLPPEQQIRRLHEVLGYEV